MDDGLKQRLIGAFVLLALAVIFVPVFFDRERMTPVDTRTQIPAPPHIEPVVIEPSIVEPSAKESETVEVEVSPKVTELAQAPSGAEMYTPNDAIEETLEPEPVSVDVEGVPNSWVLQIASFKRQEHAVQLRDKLVDSGYSAYTKNVNTKKGDMVRVYVGPKIEKNVLIQQKKEIEKKYKVSTMLLKFRA